MKPTTLEGVGSHGEAIYRGWVKSAGLDVDIEARPLDMQNDSGETLVEGDVVVVTSDGTIAKTVTANDPRPTGVCVDDIDDGESGPVQFFGPVDLINVTASVTAGTYGATSTTAGSATASSDPDGAFVYFTSDGVAPEGFLFPRGGGAGSGDADGDFLTVDQGEGHKKQTITASGAAQSLDLSLYNWFDITLTDDCTLTFTNPPSSERGREWTIILRQDGTGSRTVIWPAEVDWQDTDGTGGGAAPTLFTAATAENVVTITTLDGGVSYGGGMEGTGAGGAEELDDLSDVTITSPAEDEQLQYIGGQWVNSARRWEAVTDGEDVFVWESDDLVHEWETY